MSNIANNVDYRRQYQQTLDTQLLKSSSQHTLKYTPNDQPNNVSSSQACQSNTANIEWQFIKKCVLDSAETTAGTIKISKKVNRTYDAQIAELSTKQKQIRLRIQNTLADRERARLKKERNKVLHNIREKCIRRRNDELDKIVEDIEANHETAEIRLRQPNY